MIAVISLGYVALPLLDFLWLRLEWRSLTSLVGEQLRISRFIYLPLFVFAARVLAELERRLAPGWKRTALVLSLGLVVLGLDAPAALRAACAPPASARERDAFALYDWARTETDRDSLFYFDSADFRFRAERSITHGWKDVGLAYYAGDVAVRFHARYFAFQRGYRDPRKLRRIAAAHDVDYVVVDKQRHGDLSPDLPVAFANDSFVVYRF
jgi:hypothetical protein